MRKFLAILICRILTVVGKLMGKGTSLPGGFALKVCPDILRRIQKPPVIIAVTGSNGKTSTVEMIASVLKAGGKTIAYNAEGSNQIEGVTTMILNSCTWSGKMKQDILLIESDERYAKFTFKWFHPTHYVMTNLYRDQLTRNAHPEWVFHAIEESVFPDTKLLLNADDPQLSLFGQDRDNVVWFGLEHNQYDSEIFHGAYHDGAVCPRCGKTMEYDYYHYNHIGKFSCPFCGLKRQDTAYSVTDLNLEESRIVINGKDTISLAFRSIYNIYNILATYAVCHEVGIPGEVAAQVMSNYILKNGRLISFTLGEHPGTFLISKHENSVSYDMSFRYAVMEKKPCTVVVIVDAVSRKYFTSETSWLWDIHFDWLEDPCVKQVYLCGKYCNDLALRLSFSQVSPGKIRVFPDIDAACEELRNKGSEQVYAVTCFSDRMKFLSNVTVK